MTLTNTDKTKNKYLTNIYEYVENFLENISQIRNEL